MSDNEVTFELKDLTYIQLVDTYKNILDFIKYLDELIAENTQEEEKGKEE